MAERTSGSSATAVWFQEYREELVQNARLLNALREWMRAAAEHTSLFRELSGREVTAQELSAYGIPLAADFAAPAGDAVVLPDPVESSNTQASVRAAAWRWVQRTDLSKGAALQAAACGDWIRRNVLHETEFFSLAKQWCCFQHMKMLHVVVGMPTAAMPDIATLTVSEFEALLAEEERWNRQWRRIHESRQFLYQSTDTALLIQSNNLSAYYLNRGGRALLAFSSTQRRIDLLSGELYIDVVPLGAPFVLHVEGLEISGSALICNVKILAPWQVEISALQGYVQVRSTGKGAGIDLQLQRERLVCNVKEGQYLRHAGRADQPLWLRGAQRAATPPPYCTSNMQQALDFIAQQAARRVRELGKTLSSARTLNELRDWLMADERHLAKFRDAFDEQSDRSKLLPLPQQQWQDFNARSPLLMVPDKTGIDEAQGSPHTPTLQLVATHPTDLESEAWQWLQQLVAAPESYPIKNAAGKWADLSPRHCDAYYPLAALWVYLAMGKLMVLLAGFDTEPMPELETLQPAALRALAVQEGERLDTVRRLAADYRPAPIPVRASSERVTYINLRDNSSYWLAAGSQLEMQLSVSKRCVQLLSGSLHSVLAPYPGWPFELRVNQLCVSGEFAIYGVRRESADTLKVYCQVGAITLTWQSAAGEPHSRTLGSGECLQMHGEVHSVRPISDAEIVEQLAPRPQQRNS